MIIVLCFLFTLAINQFEFVYKGCIYGNLDAAKFQFAGDNFRRVWIQCNDHDRCNISGKTQIEKQLVLTSTILMLIIGYIWKL